MDNQVLQTIRQKLGDAIKTSFPEMVRRDAAPALLRGKAQAVIGMRRAGKTFFLQQCLADRLALGIERERLVYFNFEDERLGGLRAEELGTLIEEYYRQFPQFRHQAEVTWCLDEIQLVPGWERFVRRILDAENVEILVSGSSARMLSREVATSMRGRAMETVITPFSFREFLRGRNWPDGAPHRLPSGAERSALRAHFDAYLEIGGFPEAGAYAAARDRVGLLQGYVDTVLFRDVAERHQISNLPALRAFVRQLLRNPATMLSVSKVHADFGSRGIAVSKESLLAFLAHLEDAFLVFTVPLADRSERRRQVNPRKLYLADHGLAQAFSPVAGLDRRQTYGTGPEALPQSFDRWHRSPITTRHPAPGTRPDLDGTGPTGNHPEALPVTLAAVSTAGRRQEPGFFVHSWRLQWRFPSHQYSHIAQSINSLWRKRLAIHSGILPGRWP